MAEAFLKKFKTKEEKVPNPGPGAHTVGPGAQGEGKKGKGKKSHLWVPSDLVLPGGRLDWAEEVEDLGLSDTSGRVSGGGAASRPDRGSGSGLSIRDPLRSGDPRDRSSQASLNQNSPNDSVQVDRSYWVNYQGKWVGSWVLLRGPKVGSPFVSWVVGPWKWRVRQAQILQSWPHKVTLN